MTLDIGIEWTDVATGLTHQQRVTSIRGLNDVLDSVQAGSTANLPVFAVVTRANGDSLAIGLGHPLFVTGDGADHDFAPPWPVSTLSFVAAHGNPPYYSSVGDAQIPGMFVFYFGGQWSEFEARQAVPLAAAREAVELFVRMPDGLPAAVSWEQE